MNKKSGFTLVEVLVASIILAGTLAAILGLFAKSLGSTQSANNHIEAMSTAQMYLEMIRMRVDPTNFANTIGFANLGNWNNRTFMQGGNYSVTSYVNQVPGLPMATIQNWRVKVVVCWSEAAGRIIGEDNGAGGGTALDGVLNGLEDVNGSGEIDSPAQLETVLVRGGI